jgi:hypothetical protein
MPYVYIHYIMSVVGGSFVHTLLFKNYAVIDPFGCSLILCQEVKHNLKTSVHKQIQ